MVDLKVRLTAPFSPDPLKWCLLLAGFAAASCVAENSLDDILISPEDGGGGWNPCWSCACRGQLLVELVVRKLPRIRQSRILIMLDALLRPRQGGPQVPNHLYDVIRNLESMKSTEAPTECGPNPRPYLMIHFVKRDRGDQGDNQSNFAFEVPALNLMSVSQGHPCVFDSRDWVCHVNENIISGSGVAVAAPPDRLARNLSRSNIPRGVRIKLRVRDE